MMWRTIILLFFSLPLFGQQGMMLVGGGEDNEPAILDTFPAYFAYSFFRLSSSYTGDCIQITLQSDNTTFDIGFSGGIIDTASIIANCSGTVCYLSTFYDQTGNSRHMVATGDTTTMMEIYDGGVIRRDGHIAAVANSGDLYTNGTNGRATKTFFFVGEGYGVGSTGRIWANYDGNVVNSDEGIFQVNATGQLMHYAGNGVGGVGNDVAITGTSTDAIHVYYGRTVTGSPGTTQASIDNGSTASDAANPTDAYFRKYYFLGRETGTAPPKSFMEFIFWNEDRSSDKATILSSINNKYSIY